jgi:phosphoglycolate phosphatase
MGGILRSNKYDFVLFDLDGTLTDPGTGIINSVQYALRKMGIIEDDRERLRGFIGPPLAESFTDMYRMEPDEAWRAVEFYREYFKTKGMFENLVYPGIPELLESLKSHGQRLWVATSKPTVFSKQIIAYFQLDSFFEEIVGSELNGSRVAKTEVIAELLKMNPEIDPAHAVMVGDRKYDLIGARHNGLDSVGVLYGYGSLDELQSAGSTAIVTSVPHLLDVLSRDNSI